MADELDVISLDDAKYEMRLSGPSQDDYLPIYITAISRRLDELCGPIVIREVVETHTPMGGGILLDAWPVSAVTSVAEWSGGSASTIVGESLASPTSLDYYLDGSVLRRRSGGWDVRWAPGRGNVVVTFDAGRFDTTADVDAKFKLAAVIMLKHFWRYQQTTGSQVFGREAEDGPSIMTFAVPNAVKELLAEEIQQRVVVA